MPNLINLNSKRPLRERFNQAVNLINEFEYMTYHEASIVKREKMRNALQSRMTEIIGITAEPAREMIEFTISDELSDIFAFMIEGGSPPSRQDIENAKASGQTNLRAAVVAQAEHLGFNLDRP